MPWSAWKSAVCMKNRKRDWHLEEGDIMVTPMPADAALERYFLDARCKLLEVAAILDRIDRGDNAAQTQRDPRLARIRQALDLLNEQKDGRAERIQKLFSLDYDPSWERPKPR